MSPSAHDSFQGYEHKGREKYPGIMVGLGEVRSLTKARESADAREHLLVNIDDGVDVNENSNYNTNENDTNINKFISEGLEKKFEIKNLSKVTDKGVSILDGVDLEIPKGMIVGIIGPSGSGKSTVLRALNRLWEPPAGTVFLDGRDVCDLDVLSVRRRVGMLFQLPALFQGTVADNVRYGPKLRGKTLSDVQVQRLLGVADLDATFLNKKGNELSVGQQQRVALARTLANEPEVLLLDEPTSALDPISTQNIEEALMKLKTTQGMTVIMVSHSIRQVQRIADIVCLLVNGVVVEVLPPNQLSQAKHPMAQRFLELI